MKKHTLVSCCIIFLFLLSVPCKPAERSLVMKILRHAVRSRKEEISCYRLLWVEDSDNAVNCVDNSKGEKFEAEVRKLIRQGKKSRKRKRREFSQSSTSNVKIGDPALYVVWHAAQDSNGHVSISKTFSDQSCTICEHAKKIFTYGVTWFIAQRTKNLKNFSKERAIAQLRARTKTTCRISTIKPEPKKRKLTPSCTRCKKRKTQPFSAPGLPYFVCAQQSIQTRFATPAILLSHAINSAIPYHSAVNVHPVVCFRPQLCISKQMLITGHSWSKGQYCTLPMYALVRQPPIQLK